MKAQFISTILLAAGMMGGGMFLHSKFFTKDCICNPPEIPACPPCPQPLIKMQNLEVEKLKNVRGGFYYSPTFTGSFLLCDSIK